MNDLINNISCDVIQDIIPLYHDKVCSDKSCEYVEEHIKTCENAIVFLSRLMKSLLIQKLMMRNKRS